MAKLKFEIDTEDIFPGSEDYSPTTFENLVSDEIKRKLYIEVQQKFSKDAIEDVTNGILEKCDEQIKAKLSGLIDENLVLTNNWGKPLFVGSVEDYIKLQIDEKLLKPVDTNGNPVVGCASKDAHTWIEYQVQKQIQAALENAKTHATREAQNYSKKYINDILEDFKHNTLNDTIMERLKAVGIGTKEKQ